MAGHLGAERVTVQSLEVVRVDAERKLLLVKVLYLVLSMAMLSLSRQLKHKSRDRDGITSCRCKRTNCF